MFERAITAGSRGVVDEFDKVRLARGWIHSLDRSVDGGSVLHHRHAPVTMNGLHHSLTCCEVRIEPGRIHSRETDVDHGVNVGSPDGVAGDVYAGQNRFGDPGIQACANPDRVLVLLVGNGSIDGNGSQLI